MHAAHLTPRSAVLVVGAGSIGARHLRNLRDLRLRDLSVCDADSARVQAMSAELGTRGFAELSEALRVARPEAVLICTPPALHARQALEAVRAGADVFIEKPLSDGLEGLDELAREAEAAGRVAQVGYNWRFEAGLRRIKVLLEQGTIGRVRWAHAEFGQYLPDWRPRLDYRRSYTASRRLGGGILLDGSHELDTILWLLDAGAPTAIRCLAGKVSDLDLDVEDCATVLLRFADGAQADIHLDCVQRAYSRGCRLIGEQGTIRWDYPTRRIEVYTTATGAWDVSSYAQDLNELYVEELREFLACVATRRRPTVDLAQARRVLEIVCEAKASAEPAPSPVAG
jgi:predicted dehydrogenase